MFFKCKLTFILLFVVLMTFSAIANGKGDCIVFSEMTIDSCPGDDGSWVELYNNNDKTIRLDGVTLICNDKIIFKFPRDKIIYPKKLLLIRFDENTKKINWSRYENGVIVSPIFPRKVKNEPQLMHRNDRIAEHYPVIRNRAPGYCAIFKSGQILKDNLLDFVLWGKGFYAGEYLKEIGKSCVKWAKEKTIWINSDGITISLEPLKDGICYSNPIALKRKNFKKENRVFKCWNVEFLADATPGSGNAWCSFNSFYLIDGDSFQVGEKLQLNFRKKDFDSSFFDYAKDEKIRYKVQIAKDPHFEEVIYKKIVPKDGKINDYNFQAGTYFIKFRAETDKVCTNWSPAQDFRYYNKENTEDENYDDKDDVDIEFGTE